MEKVEKFRGTEIILSNENASLKQKIKDLKEEIERLRGENQWLMGKLHQVKHIVMFDETTSE